MAQQEVSIQLHHSQWSQTSQVLPTCHSVVNTPKLSQLWETWWVLIRISQAVWAGSWRPPGWGIIARFCTCNTGKSISCHFLVLVSDSHQAGNFSYQTGWLLDVWDFYNKQKVNCERADQFYTRDITISRLIVTFPELWLKYKLIKTSQLFSSVSHFYMIWNIKNIPECGVILVSSSVVCVCQQTTKHLSLCHTPL